MDEILLHDLETKAAELPLFISRIETLDEVIQTSEPDRHTFYEVLWLKNAAGWHYIDFESYAIRTNTLFFIAPGQIHFWDVPQPSTGYVLLFAEELFRLDSATPGFLQEFICSPTAHSQPVLYAADEQVNMFDQLFQRLLDEHAQQGLGWRTAMRALIELVMIQARRIQSPAPVPTTPKASTLLARRFRTLVERQFAQAHTVEPYANTLGVTTGYLTEAVHDATGLAAGELIRERIVLEAKRFLIHTDDTLEAISTQLGFNNSSYFNRFFRRETGATPDGFRREFRKKYHLSRD
jgi:AraC family transcriptional regulator, transcriptional activator of pobA